MTTFQRILDVYSLRDPALCFLGKIVADVVDHVMHDQDRAGLVQREPLTAGVLALAEGNMLLGATDGECLQRSLPLYDALYARLQAQIAIEHGSLSPPASVLEQTIKFSMATSLLRKAAESFSSQSFANALRDGSPHD
jgi:hypothetical protein